MKDKTKREAVLHAASLLVLYSCFALKLKPRKVLKGLPSNAFKTFLVVR